MWSLRFNFRLVFSRLRAALPVLTYYSAVSVRASFFSQLKLSLSGRSSRAPSTTASAPLPPLLLLPGERSGGGFMFVMHFDMG